MDKISPPHIFLRGVVGSSKVNPLGKESAMGKEALVRGRLKKGLAKEVVEWMTLPIWYANHHRLFKPFNHINIAHVIMLQERGLLEPNNARVILSVLLDLEKGDPARVKPGIGGELYLDLERYIIDQIGEDIGGRMHTGRSRNDLIATGQRMALRDPLDDLLKKFIELRKVILHLAQDHAKSVMPGYTHLQHAQPISLGHYFVAFAYALSRDAWRLENAFQSLDLCPLGTGALAGVTFPIDRYRTASLLGFRDIVPNALDAVASRDYAFDIVSALAMTSCNLSRLSADLYLWNTYEFGFIEMGDEYSEISSIMPQKKNPFILEHCRGRAGHVFGNLMALLTTLKGVPFTHSRDVAGEVMPAVWGALETTSSVVSVLPGLLKSLRFRVGRMKEFSGAYFSTVTDLVDLMVKEKGLSFRTAHHIVAGVVDSMIQKGKTPEDITAQTVDKEAIKIIGHPIKLKESQVRSALLPEACVERRSLPGGTASAEVKRLAEEALEDLFKEEKNLERRGKKRRRAENLLLNTARKLVSGSH